MMDMEREVNDIVVHAFATGESEHDEYGFPRYAVHIIDARPDRDAIIPLSYPTRKEAEKAFHALISEIRGGWDPFSHDPVEVGTIPL